MSRQLDMFSTAPPKRGNSDVKLSHERYEGALAMSAIGDALGWPTEFIRPDAKRRPAFELPVEHFVKWKKFVGGRFWGYLDEIAPGEYSDDTQLTLAVARCISESGDFEPERFAYSELPLWLHYERGGGRSVKLAARTMITSRTDWLHNFYKQPGLSYREAGANGAAMRNLPIALASAAREDRLVRDSVFNAIITHGHPRAILGTVLIGLAVRHTLIEMKTDAQTLVEYLKSGLKLAERVIGENGAIQSWAGAWDKGREKSEPPFSQGLTATQREAHHFLSLIVKKRNASAKEYASEVGALSPETRGSGLASVCSAIFLFLKNASAPYSAVAEAANLIGSDTDTTAAFVGALIGAHFGSDAIPPDLWASLQDHEYISRTAQRLHRIATGNSAEEPAGDEQFDREQAYAANLAWEIGLHEMFWDTIDVNDSVTHPSLGRGQIVQRDVRKTLRSGYDAKLIRIRFDIGQSCIFHSRVKQQSRVSESLAQELDRALEAATRARHRQK